MFPRETRNQAVPPALAPGACVEFQGGNIGIVAEGFLVDRKAAGRAQRVIENYRDNLTHFVNYLGARALKHIHEHEPIVQDALKRMWLVVESLAQELLPQESKFFDLPL